MDRVLQITDGMAVGGGIQSFIMNVYRNVDREKVQFDFLLHRHNEKSYEDEIKKLGGRIYYVPGRKEGIKENKKGLDDFFTHHPEYKVVHFHASSLSYCEPLLAAEKHGVPIRIMHSHSSRIIGKKRLIHLVLHKLHKRNISNMATSYLTCGSLAGEWMYGGTSIENDVRIIKNGIDLKRFTFDYDKRSKLRTEMNLSDCFVICHVGRFETVKNHKFLLEVFLKIYEKKENARLLLVGNGTQLESIKQHAKDLGIDKVVKFLGIRNDVEAIYQIADSVVFPSLYEGFPVTAIEVQASGTPIVMSDTITKEALIKPNAFAISLSESPEAWADCVLANTEKYPDNTGLYNLGLDIGTTVKELMKIYGL